VQPGSFGLLAASSFIVVQAPFLELKPKNSLSIWQKIRHPEEFCCG